MSEAARTSQAPRRASLARHSSETDIRMAIDLDGQGRYQFDTEIPFFDHMLSHISKHSLIDIELFLRGDLGIDCHHSVEDTAIVFGQLLRQALGDRVGVTRYGHFTLTMDECLVTVAVDLGGRFHFSYKGPDTIKEGKFGIYDAELSLEFLQKFAMHGAMNLHVLVHYGDNRHHIHEGVFKALGRALRMAVSIDARLGDGLYSTKGLFD